MKLKDLLDFSRGNIETKHITIEIEGQTTLYGQHEWVWYLGTKALTLTEVEELLKQDIREIHLV